MLKRGKSQHSVPRGPHGLCVAAAAAAAAPLSLELVPLRTLKLIYVVYKYAVRTSQRSQSATVRK